MSTRTFALVFGIVFLLAGASGFIPGMLHPHLVLGLVAAYFGLMGPAAGPVRSK